MGALKNSNHQKSVQNKVLRGNVKDLLLSTICNNGKTLRRNGGYKTLGETGLTDFILPAVQRFRSNEHYLDRESLK